MCKSVLAPQIEECDKKNIKFGLDNNNKLSQVIERIKLTNSETITSYKIISVQYIGETCNIGEIYKSVKPTEPMKHFGNKMLVITKGYCKM